MSDREIIIETLKRSAMTLASLYGARAVKIVLNIRGNESNPANVRTEITEFD